MEQQKPRERQKTTRANTSTTTDQPFVPLLTSDYVRSYEVYLPIRLGTGAMVNMRWLSTKTLKIRLHFYRNIFSSSDKNINLINVSVSLPFLHKRSPLHNVKLFFQINYLQKICFFFCMLHNPLKAKTIRKCR